MPEPARATEVARFPDAGLLNGMTVLDPSAGVLLIADSIKGVVWSLNVRTGATGVAINDTTMAPTEGLGINGLHVRDDSLFFDNTAKRTFNRIPIDIKTGRATGPAVALLANKTTLAGDDFTFDLKGNAWVVSGSSNEVYFLANAADPTNEPMSIDSVAIIGDPTQLLGLTSARFGISTEDRRRGSLYVTSNGGVPQYMEANWTMGGTISRVDLHPHLGNSNRLV